MQEDEQLHAAEINSLHYEVFLIMRTLKGSTIEEIVNLPVSWRKKMLALCDYYVRMEKAEADKIRTQK